ncbi:hypothetical protein [Alicyclobacillus acidiphilus]|uniref:hypothetical protein n=1 Tax=Alicyclobacillus acidiphilus TaxID=182455 RepID=UPI00082BC82A|nr:hypothetical protein [Alicyclobacillus acidiphilus]
MNLWECIVCVAVVVIALPFVYMAETNALAAVARAQAVDGAAVALGSASDAWLAGQNVPSLVGEEGVSYRLQTVSKLNTTDVCPNAFAIQIGTAGSDETMDEVDIPECPVGFLTH